MRFKLNMGLSWKCLIHLLESLKPIRIKGKSAAIVVSLCVIWGVLSISCSGLVTCLSPGRPAAAAAIATLFAGACFDKFS